MAWSRTSETVGARAARRVRSTSGGLLLLAVVVALGCGGGGGEQASGPAPAQSAENPAQTGAGASAGTARDVAALDVCELASAEEVAAAVGGTALRPASRSDTGEVQGCTYSLDPAGADTMETCIVYVEPASYFEFSRDPSEGETAEAIEGLGDEAVMKHNPVEHQYSLVVLRQGDLMLEVKTDTAEDARKVAELILSKL